MHSEAGGIRIPQKEIVKFIINQTLKSKKAATQEELSRIITSGLSKGDAGYRITGRRARLIALEMPVRVKTETKKGPVPRKCPVCFHGLKKTYSKNLFGKNILTGLSCSRCGYKGNGGKWVPRKYTFELK